MIKSDCLCISGAYLFFEPQNNGLILGQSNGVRHPPLGFINHSYLNFTPLSLPLYPPSLIYRDGFRPRDLRRICIRQNLGSPSSPLGVCDPKLLPDKPRFGQRIIRISPCSRRSRRILQMGGLRLLLTTSAVASGIGYLRRLHGGPRSLGVCMAPRLRPPAAYIPHAAYSGRHSRAVLHIRVVVLQIHFQPRHDAPSAVLKEPGQTGDTYEFEGVPGHDDVDATLVPGRGYGILEII